MSEKMMPSPEELKIIQEENMTNKQIKQSEKREKIFESKEIEELMKPDLNKISQENKDKLDELDEIEYVKSISEKMRNFLSEAHDEEEIRKRLDSIKEVMGKKFELRGKKEAARWAKHGPSSNWAARISLDDIEGKTNFYFQLLQAQIIAEEILSKKEK